MRAEIPLDRAVFGLQIRRRSGHEETTRLAGQIVHAIDFLLLARRTAVVGDEVEGNARFLAEPVNIFE